MFHKTKVKPVIRVEEFRRPSFHDQPSLSGSEKNQDSTIIPSKAFSFLIKIFGLRCLSNNERCSIAYRIYQGFSFSCSVLCTVIFMKAPIEAYMNPSWGHGPMFLRLSFCLLSLSAVPIAIWMIWKEKKLIKLRADILEMFVRLVGLQRATAYFRKQQRRMAVTAAVMLILFICTAAYTAWWAPLPFIRRFVVAYLMGVPWTAFTQDQQHIVYFFMANFTLIFTMGIICVVVLYMILMCNVLTQCFGAFVKNHVDPILSIGTAFQQDRNGMELIVPHDQLRDITQRVIDIFSPILFLWLSSFTIGSCLFIKGASTWLDTPAILSVMVRPLMSNLMVVIWMCRAGEKLKEASLHSQDCFWHLINNMCTNNLITSTDTSKKVQMIMTYILNTNSKPLYLTAMGYFTIQNELFISMTGAICTYTVILLQSLGASKPEEEF